MSEVSRFMKMKKHNTYIQSDKWPLSSCSSYDSSGLMVQACHWLIVSDGHSPTIPP